MNFQTVTDGGNETVFRSVRNSTTKTSTAVIAAGSPVMLETAVASANGGWGRQSLGSAAAETTLLLGLAHTVIPADSVGLVQCYGVDNDALIATAGATVGANCAGNVGTLAAIGTVSGAGGASIIVLVAPTGAAVAPGSVFLRCM